jgi:hypothetical protein
MLAVLNFVSKRVVIVVENLLLSSQGDYHVGNVLLCKVATTLLSELLIEQGCSSRVPTQLSSKRSNTGCMG